MSKFVSFELVTDDLATGLRQCAGMRSTSKRFWLTRLNRIDGSDGHMVWGRKPTKELVLRGVAEVDDETAADQPAPFDSMASEAEFDDILQNTGQFRFSVYGEGEPVDVAPECKRLFGGGGALGAVGAQESAKPQRTTKSAIEEADRYRKERHG